MVAGTGGIKVDWKDTLIVGDTLIDEQHRAFLVDLDTMMDAIDAGSGDGDIMALYHRFRADLVDHFRDEEAMLERIDFPEQDVHADEHRQLLSSVTAIESMLNKGSGSEDMRLVIRSLFSGLVDHLVAEDLRYKAWLKGRE